MRSITILHDTPPPVNIDWWEEDGASYLVEVESMEEVAEQLARWQVNRRDYSVDAGF